MPWTNLLHHRGDKMVMLVADSRSDIKVQKWDGRDMQDQLEFNNYGQAEDQFDKWVEEYLRDVVE